jgi:argininosuccinate synthase
MRHHENVIHMRKNGFKPACIHLEAGNFVPDWKWWPEHDLSNARVEIQAQDSPHHLDLRFVVGCQVRVDGTDRTRVRALFDKAQASGAERVIGHVSDDTNLIEIMDTEGVMTWQK